MSAKGEIARKFYRAEIVPPSGVGLDHPTWKEVWFDHILMILVCHCISLIANMIFSLLVIYTVHEWFFEMCLFFLSTFRFYPKRYWYIFCSFAFLRLAWSWWNQPTSHTVLKIVKCAWENSDVSSSVQDFHRWHFEIVTSAAVSTPKEVRAYPQRGSGPVSQAHLERGLRLDLVINKSLLIIKYYQVYKVLPIKRQNHSHRVRIHKNSQITRMYIPLLKIFQYRGPALFITCRYHINKLLC